MTAPTSVAADPLFDDGGPKPPLPMVPSAPIERLAPIPTARAAKAARGPFVAAVGR